MYNKDLKLTISKINGNIAHTCGNITSLMLYDFKQNLPPNFFKTEHISTKLAVRQFQNIKKIVDFKKQKPILVMQPKIILDKPDPSDDIFRRMFGTNIFDLTRPDNHNVKFFKDSEKGIILDFSVERIKMSFEFSIIVSTEYQQYNIASMINDSLIIDSPYYYNHSHGGAILETVIPDSIIQQISADSGIPIKDKDGSIMEFLNYLNKISNIPITYQLQTATDTYKFFMAITTNILMTYSGLSISDGQVENMISDYFPISIQLDVECAYPNAFYYLTKAKEVPYIDKGNNQDIFATTGNIELHYTFQQTLVPPKDSNNKDLFTFASIDIEEGEQDIIDLKPIFTKDKRDIITRLEIDERHVVDEYVNIRLYRDGKMLAIDKDYRINWITLELIIFNTKKKYHYDFACYLDNLIYNKYVLSNIETYSQK